MMDYKNTKINSFADILKHKDRLLKTHKSHTQIAYDPDKYERLNAPKTVTAGLEPYGGTWGKDQAAHLLRRTVYGPTQLQISDAVNAGMDATISNLISDRSLPDEPVNPSFLQDNRVPVGESWVYKKVDPAFRNQIRGYRVRSLYSWTMDNMIHHDMSIIEKMTLFWHNHLPTAGFNVPNYMYKYYLTLRQHAVGNIKQLIKDITIDPLMLRYLDGRLNRKGAANENYARELMELFVLDKGPQVGDGDYTTYTEHDVIELAKILTGWRDQGAGETEDGEPSAFFTKNRHDTSTKTLSGRLGNKVFENADEKEYIQLIDFLFEQDATAIFFAKELYKWFVYYEIDDQITANVIEPLAQVLRDNDYEIKPALTALLSSEHFYDFQVAGAMIKNPMDFVLGMFTQFEIELAPELDDRYAQLLDIYRFIADIQMQWYNPPDVAGWKAYYQEPVYYQIWIDSVTLPLRQLATNFVVAASIDAIKLMESTSNPQDINDLIADLGNILHPRPLSEFQIDQLKPFLIPGLPDFEWTEEYFIWKSDPTNPDKVKVISDKLKVLISKLLIMPEYYLM